MNQQTPIVFSPDSGWRVQGHITAQQWRDLNGPCAFLFNPWDGIQRDARDVGTDPFGLLIQPPGERTGAET